MAGRDFDLITIGGGSGGVRASRMAASLGARVAIAESRRLGGTCVNLGCVPKKLLVYGSQFAAAFEDARGFGWTIGDHGFDWSRLIANKDREIERLNGVYRTLLEDSGATILEGRARLVDRHTVDVGGERFTARTILIATGGRPYVLDIPGSECGITSDDAFHLAALPRRRSQPSVESMPRPTGSGRTCYRRRHTPAMSCEPRGRADGPAPARACRPLCQMHLEPRNRPR